MKQERQEIPVLLLGASLLLGVGMGLAMAYRTVKKRLRRAQKREADQSAYLQNEERCCIILERAQDVLFEWDAARGYMYCSPNFREKFGYMPREDSVLAEEGSIRVYREDIPAFRCMLRRLTEGKADYAEEELRLLDDDGEKIWCMTKITVIRTAGGAPERFLGLISDIDAQKRERLELEKKASCDQSTGVYNKVTLENKVEEYLCGEGKNGVHALFIVDLDHFKSINDGYGHACGDYAIHEAATRLKALFRETDIAGRVGGDEFVVLLKNAASTETIRERAKLILRRIGEPMRGAEEVGAIRCSASVGVALYPADGTTFRRLYQNADRALYVSKERGRGAFHLYNSAWMAQDAHRPAARTAGEKKASSNHW